MDYEEEKKRHISFCGAYCHTCDWFTGNLRRTFQSALDLLEEYGFEKLLEDNKVDAENLKSGLKFLANLGICSGCKAEVAKNSGDWCKVRQCCYGKGFDLCIECPQFLCELLKTHPEIVKFHCIENLIEIKDKGVKHWVDKHWKSL